MREDARKRLLPAGTVLRVRTQFEDNTAKEKRIIVAHVDETTSACLINTSDGHFQVMQPELLICQATMLQGEHPFMDHDSHVDCSRLRPYPTDWLLEQIELTPSRRLGVISPALRVAMLSALKHAPHISVIEMNRVLASFQ